MENLVKMDLPMTKRGQTGEILILLFKIFSIKSFLENLKYEVKGLNFSKISVNA
jgi:hypothetical protein